MSPRRDRRIARIDRDVARKGLVDLQSVNRNSLQAPQRGIAGTEIVEGDLDATVGICATGTKDSGPGGLETRSMQVCTMGSGLGWKGARRRCPRRL